MTHSRHAARWHSAVACALLIAAFTLTATPARAQITTPIPPIPLYLPSLIQANGPEASVCPTTSDAIYASVPVEGSPRRAPYPPVNDPDLNLVERSYQATNADLGLVDIGGHTDTTRRGCTRSFRRRVCRPLPRPIGSTIGIGTARSP